MGPGDETTTRPQQNVRFYAKISLAQSTWHSQYPSGVRVCLVWSGLLSKVIYKYFLFCTFLLFLKKKSKTIISILLNLKSPLNRPSSVKALQNRSQIVKIFSRSYLTRRWPITGTRPITSTGLPIVKPPGPLSPSDPRSDGRLPFTVRT